MKKFLISAICILIGAESSVFAMSAGWTAALQNHDFQAQLTKLSGSERSENNRVEILHMGMVATPRRFQEIANASTSIYQIVPYWLKEGVGTSQYQKLLAQKEANPSLDIRFLFDWASPFGSKDLFKTRNFKKLEELSDGHTYYWNHIAWKKPWSLKFLHNRIHEKIMIFDNDKLIVGSMNVGKEHFEGGRTSAGWHDTDVIAQGPIAKIASDLFLRLAEITDHLRHGGVFPETEFDMYRLFEAWLRPNFYGAWERDVTDSYGLLKPYENERSRSFARSAAINSQGANLVSGGVPVRFIYTNPIIDRTEDQKKPVSKLFETMKFLFTKAQKQIRIYAPYLALTDEMRNLFVSTANRGIKIEVITNSIDSNDLGTLNYAGGLANYKALINAGVSIYEWQGHKNLEYLAYDHKCKISYWPGATLHTKAVMIDDSLTLVGSHNLNHRSNYYNSETMLLVEDSRFNYEMQNIFDKDLDEGTDRRINCGDGSTQKREPYVRKIGPFKMNILLEEHADEIRDAESIPEYL